MRNFIGMGGLHQTAKNRGFPVEPIHEHICAAEIQLALGECYRVLPMRMVGRHGQQQFTVGRVGIRLVIDRQELVGMVARDLRRFRRELIAIDHVEPFVGGVG